jgi:hypothetical protein
MKIKILFLIILLSFSVMSSPLDSLIKKSSDAEKRLHTKHDNISDVSKGSRAKSIEDFDETPNVITGVYLLEKINKLEIDLAKTTVVLQSLQSQSSAHADNSDFNLRLLEIVIGAIVTLGLALIKLFIPTKKKEKS